ncbi:MAG TPA: fatty acid--CoA ligase family protein [Caulobacteraceae bacterium]
MYILEQISAMRRQKPDALAMACNGVGLSYDLFWRRILAARRFFEASGVAGAGVAAVWVDSLAEGWIIDLALRSLGLTTAMLRGGEQLELFAGPDLAWLVTLASENKRDIAAAIGVSRIETGGGAYAPDAGPPADALPSPLPAPGGHILLTSGTTGRYKKVLTTVGADAKDIEGRHARYAALGEGVTPQGPASILNLFDLGLWTAAGYQRPMMTWSVGGGVIFRDGPDFHRAFDWPGITHTLTTPHYLSRLMAQPQDAFAPQKDMQLIIVGGALSKPLANETRRRLTARIVISLAATEVGGWARTVVESDEDLRWYRLDPERTVEVVDEDRKPLALGRLGEVRVKMRQGGPAGYLDDASANASFFGDGWFYPGDLGVLDGKGRLALFGRVTDIIHVQGDKHPAEPLERELQEKLGCDGVCVLSAPDQSGVEKLHVFIESRRVISQAELSQAASAVLYGFPGARFHLVAALPRTANGKVKRQALTAAFHQRDA